MTHGQPCLAVGRADERKPGRASPAAMCQVLHRNREGDATSLRCPPCALEKGLGSGLPQVLGGLCPSYNNSAALSLLRGITETGTSVHTHSTEARRALPTSKPGSYFLYISVPNGWLRHCWQVSSGVEL